MINLGKEICWGEFDELFKNRLKRGDSILPKSILEEIKAGRGLWFRSGSSDMRSLKWSDCLWVGKFGRW